MPFVIRPPLNSAAAEDPSLIFTIIEPEPYERLILRDLQAWDWRVTRHDFGDEDFIDALMQIEKDIKKRRRQTHAIGGELYGYQARPTLEQVWELEAERILDEGAYEEQKDPRRSAVVEDDDEENRSQEAEKTWLRSIDRTRQWNSFLEYTDPDHEYPRLVTQGLDHNCSCEITATKPKRPSHYHRALSHMSKSRTLGKHIVQQRAKSFRDILTSLNQLVIEQNQAMQNPTHLPFIFDFPTRNFESTIVPERHNNPNTIQNTPVPTPHNHNSHNWPYLHPSQSTTSLIFPHTHLSEREYVRQTRRGIKRSKSCPPRPRNEDEDPYGWLEWDRQMRRKEEGKAQKKEFRVQMQEVRAHLRWFVWREGRKLGSVAGRREGEE